jgi:drug/metabolite transporter (DMT)-like permease
LHTGVIAVLGGFGAAACWAGAAVCASRSTKLIGPWSVLAWVMLTGFVVAAPPTVASGIPDALGAHEVWLLAVSGAGNVAGLLFEYAALRVGKVAIVTPIVSTEGALTAVIAIAAGETLGAGVGAMLVLISVGVVLASIAPGGGSGDPLRASLLAGGSALCFGVSLYATARLGVSLPLVWAVIPARFVGVAAVALPLAATRRLRLTRAAVPFVVASGLCEVGGAALFVLGSRHSIAVSAVLASQFAALAALTAFVLFHERLTRVQLAGIAVIAVGVAVLSALQA